MKVEDIEMSRMVKAVSAAVSDIAAKRKAVEAYELLMDQKPSRRKSLEQRYQRISLLRRAFEAGYEQGKAKVKDGFKELIE